ncbi:MAG: FAD-dependent oxidoreductase [Spirochaetaceae bacterium]
MYLRGRSSADEAEQAEQAEQADAVFLLTGYGPDSRLRKEAGVRFHRQTGRRLFDPETLETKTPGIFVCGTVALKVSGEQQTSENGRDHASAMLPRLTRRVGSGA